MRNIIEAALVLTDGSVFEGEAIGAHPGSGVTGGEVVFNTVLTGYQEVITDPSYAGQIIAFTNPHIGNYGVTELDHESRRPFCRGIIVRDLARRSSSWRSDGDLGQLLKKRYVPGLAGIDTRRLTRHIRDVGAMSGAFGTAPETVLREAASSEQGTTGIDLASAVSCDQAYIVTGEGQAGGGHRIVAIDYGIKSTILSQLAQLGSVEVVPSSTSAAEIIDREPDGIFLSNGPGDPRSVVGAVSTIRDLIGAAPIFGVCLGHQLLSLAIGAEVSKMVFGHHGGNHPVKNLDTGVIEITSQNHNFAVEADSLGDMAEMTHVNLNDGVCEGIRLRDAPAFSVQHHPEASPGPNDSTYLFGEFESLIVAVNGKT